MVIGDKVACSHPIHHLSNSCIRVFIWYFNVVIVCIYMIFLCGYRHSISNCSWDDICWCRWTRTPSYKHQG